MLWATVRRLWKWFLHLVTGTSELERICLQDIPAYQRTIKIEEYFKESRQLASAGLSARLANLPADADLDEICAAVLNAKVVDNAAVDAALRESLGHMVAVSSLVATLDRARAPYDSDNAEHEAMLMRLWALLRPNVLLTARKSLDWQEIGFQGRDPATDFRSMGVLGLSNMLELCEQYPRCAQTILLDTTSHSNWFGFAITSINITADVLKQLKDKQLNSYFYREGATSANFTALYAEYFMRFNKLWAARNPENVMSFGPIRDEFLAEMHARAAADTLQGLTPEVFDG